MPTLNVLLHLLRDHIATVRAILERNEATGEVRERLLRHIASEEAENQGLLLAQLPQAAPAARRQIELAVEHSRFLLDIIRGDELQPGLSLELLEHFQEEHDVGSLAPVPEAEPPDAPKRPGWTVGSLLTRGTQ